MLETIGQYRLLEPIGSGNGGELYRARDTRVGRTVAVRLLPAEVSASGERPAFERAAATAVCLSHPNIASTYEIGEHDGRLFVVTEFVAGQTVRSIVAGRPIQVRRALDIASQIADALAEAHAAGAAHLGLSADAVVVTPKGSAKLLDFGLRHWTAPGGSSVLHPASDAQAADLRGVGVLLFEMLTGQRPSSASVPSSLNKLVPRELDSVVTKAMAEPGGYEAAATLAADLRAVAASLPAPEIDGAVISSLSRSPAGRGRGRPIVLAAGALLALAAALAWWMR
jgi:serine/threonine protein kinase